MSYRFSIPYTAPSIDSIAKRITSPFTIDNGQIVHHGESYSVRMTTDGFSWFTHISDGRFEHCIREDRRASAGTAAQRFDLCVRDPVPFLYQTRNFKLVKYFLERLGEVRERNQFLEIVGRVIHAQIVTGSPMRDHHCRRIMDIGKRIGVTCADLSALAQQIYKSWEAAKLLR